MARSEYWSCPLRLPTPAAAHVAIASGVSQRVTSPRRTRARSYSAQFPTRYVVVYVGCTLDFTSRSCPAGGRDGQHAGHCSPTALNQRTSAALHLSLPAASEGNPPLTYDLSPDLPAGLTFDASARTLTGTPTAVLPMTGYIYTVTDDDDDTASIQFQGQRGRGIHRSLT